MRIEYYMYTLFPRTLQALYVITFESKILSSPLPGQLWMLFHKTHFHLAIFVPIHVGLHLSLILCWEQGSRHAPLIVFEVCFQGVKYNTVWHFHLLFEMSMNQSYNCGGTYTRTHCAH